MTGSIAAWRLISRLMADVIRRFQLDVWTLNL